MVQELVTWLGDFTADIPIVAVPVLRTLLRYCGSCVSASRVRGTWLRLEG
jgi:hypothetical protein